MTEPDEATLSEQPAKAHGDALEEVVDARPDATGDDKGEDEPGSQQQD